MRENTPKNVSEGVGGKRAVLRTVRLASDGPRSKFFRGVFP